MRFWGRTGAFWGGLTGILFSSAFLIIPVVGHVIVLGPLVSSLIGDLEGAAVAGATSALFAALVGLGIPKDSVVQYENDVKAGKSEGLGRPIRERREGREVSPPSVWRVPWMNRLRFVAAGPDRVCAFSRTPAEFRCWARPRPDASLAQELPRDRGAPQRDLALGPNEALLAPPRTFVGGTFGCVVHATGAVGCVDDAPGRLGGATQSAATSCDDC